MTPASSEAHGTAGGEVVRGPGPAGRVPSRGFRALAVVTVVVTYLLIAWGGVVRVTGSGLGCGTKDDWPLCHGGLLPPAQQDAIIEFTHRWLAATSTVLVVLLAVAVWSRYRHLRRVTAAMTAVVVLFAVQIALGAATVELKLPGGVVMVHLANALLLLGALVLVAVEVMLAPRPQRAVLDPARARSARLMLYAAGATYLLVLSGAFVVANGAGYACNGWPLCGGTGGFRLDADQMAHINVFHRFVAGAVALFLGYSVAATMRSWRGVAPVRRAAMAVNLLLLAQIVAGAVLVELRLPPATRGLHEALASALWATTAMLALLVRPGMLRAAPAGPRRRDAARAETRGTARPETVPS